MKILYISKGEGADYECDMIFHGLRSLLGEDVVDINKIGFMYKGTQHPPFYTLYALLDDIDVDRSDIINKIRNRYFDAIVYGSVHRYREFVEEVCSVYPPSKIVFIDGEDDNVIHPMVGRGHYFKREILEKQPNIQPIQFAIPKEKILSSIPAKTRLLSPLDPRDRSTYIYYDSEAHYYEQYGESYFGRTMKKGGWDCCRHYEIMAAGALPLFDRLEECPEWTMFWLPKKELLEAKRLFEHWDTDRLPEYGRLLCEVRDILRRELTTEAMAKRILEKIG